MKLRGKKKIITIDITSIPTDQPGQDKHKLEAWYLSVVVVVVVVVVMVVIVLKLNRVKLNKQPKYSDASSSNMIKC